MLAIAQVLGELLENNFSSYLNENRDCRLLVPGLTPKIARQLHDFMINKGIKSYLVVGEEEQPGESTGLIRAVGLTSKRIGSFIAIASPGQLVHIQDSIRGSGGAIRSMAFSEEWPWIDNGSEPFRFDGPVLDGIVSRWSEDQDKKEWIREFTLNGLVKSTQASSRRAQLLLEEILGTFESSHYPGIDDVRDKLLFHSGVPQTSGDIPAVEMLIRSTSRLGQKVIERCQRDEDVREQARDRVTEIESIPEDKKDEVRDAVDSLLDGIGRNTATDLGLLAFNSCWGSDKNDSSHWRHLTADCLAEIFDVKEHEKAEVNYIVHCDRAIIAGNVSKLATFVGEEVRLDISYKIPLDQFDGHAWEVQVLNRQRVISRQVLNDARGQFPLTFNTVDSTASYSRKVPVRIALLRDGTVDADARLDMHLCGEERPTFTIIEPGFFIVDATLNDSEETPDKKFDVDEPVHLHLFSHDAADVGMYDGDETSLDVIETEISGIWRSGQPVDVGAEPSGQVVRVCRFGDYSTVICFEAKNLEKGEFTLEDELRVVISSLREKRLNELVDLFLGKSRKPYPALGQIDDAARQRMAIASTMTSRTGWRPLLIDLFKPGSQGTGSLGNFVNHLGHVDGDSFSMLKLPEEALPLLEAYSDTRDAVRKEIESRIDCDGINLEHPVYASHPIFSRKRTSQTEQALAAYLEAYYTILDYLENHQKHIEWLQLFVLSHLDCAVHWDNSRLRHAIILVGPWHPLVLAKRYMVQAALFARAERILQKHDRKSFRHLASLLGRVQGFRWLVGVSADDRELEPMYASATSDPGWHLAFKPNCNYLAIGEGVGGLAGVFRKIRHNFGLTTEIIAGASETLVVTCLSSYLRAFPSRRSIGVRIRRGYVEKSIVAAVDRYLHSEEGPTKQGLQLPGGVRLYFEEDVSDTGDARWSDPPFYLYRFLDDAECFRNEYPDIYMLPPTDEPSFKGASEKYGLPRGTGLETVFAQPLNWLTEGQSLVPISITCEFDASQRHGGGIGGAFARATTKTGSVLGDSLVTVRRVELPQRLDAPWVIIPGKGIDPAVLVKYVRDGEDRAIHERALWDYKLDIARNDTTFFILSTIPKGFQVAVNGFFERNDIANSFIVELGRIGISIGGEALKSGRHALGVVGLVGAVRLFLRTGSTIPVPIVCSSRAVGFLVPVDSFASFFGKVGSTQSDLGGKRSDLLAIQMVLPGEEHARMTISCCGIEAKFTSGTFGVTRAHDALEQAHATAAEFKMLVEASLCSGAMPERLGLLELLKFGLRISGPSAPREIETWIQTEAAVYKAILAGNYEYCDPSHSGVLVTTEEQLPGVAEHIVFQKGLWVRLTKGHWPGISDTQQLVTIRQELSHLFSTCVEQVAKVDATSIRESLKGEISQERELTGKESTAASESTIITESHGEQVDIGRGEEGEVSSEAGPLDQIFLGVDDGRRSVYFSPQSPVDPLDNMNLMVTGSSGTGKTQLLKYVICKVREQDKPVLILDFKNDFASDASFTERSGLDRISVNFDGLPYNPLIPSPVRHPVTGEWFFQSGQHIAGVASVLKRTYGLGAQQQAAVKNAVVAEFSSAGISTSGSARYSDEMNFPDFSHVGDILRQDNPSAYNRLDPLFTLGLFKDEFRKASFQSLVGRSAILDLSQIPSDEIKNTLAQLVVLSAHAYYNSQSHSGTIRQVLVFDEAHRVLKSDYMLRLVRECRAYGVATLLSSQFPLDFPSEVSASMATKVIHGNGRDSDRVKGIIQIIGCGGRESDVANLDRFQAFIDNRHHPHTLVRTMNYPLYLVWAKLQELGTATREELSQAEGIDTSKLPIVNLVRQLERLGLAEEREGQVFLLDNV